MQTVAGPSALTRLLLKSFSDDMTPGCSELACLHHPTLRKLSVSFTQVLEAEGDYTCVCTMLRLMLAGRSSKGPISGPGAGSGCRAGTRVTDTARDNRARTVLTPSWCPLRPPHPTGVDVGHKGKLQ